MTPLAQQPVSVLHAVRDALGLTGKKKSTTYHVNPPRRPANVLADGRVLRTRAPRDETIIGYHMIEDQDGNEIVHMHQQRTVTGRCKPMPTPIYRHLPLAVYRDIQYKARRAARGRFVGVFRSPVRA